MIKNGKKPLSSRPNSGPKITEESVFGDFLSIPQAIKDSIEAQGKEYRLVDAKQLRESGNYHKRGWTPYVTKAGDKIDSAESLMGTSVDNTLRRGSLVLAVRPKALGDQHREILNQRRKAYQLSTAKEQVSQMQDMAKGSGIEISTGYDD